MRNMLTQISLVQTWFTGLTTIRMDSIHLTRPILIVVPTTSRTGMMFIRVLISWTLMDLLATMKPYKEVREHATWLLHWAQWVSSLTLSKICSWLNKRMMPMPLLSSSTLEANHGWWPLTKKCCFNTVIPYLSLPNQPPTKRLCGQLLWRKLGPNSREII
jgi:hypothetical protein